MIIDDKIDDSVQQPNYARDLTGMFQTVSVPPTWTPRRFIDQIVIYKSGSTRRLYWYDSVNAVWQSVIASDSSLSPSLSPSVSPSPSLSPSKSPSVSPS